MTVYKTYTLDFIKQQIAAELSSHDMPYQRYLPRSVCRCVNELDKIVVEITPSSNTPNQESPASVAAAATYSFLQNKPSHDSYKKNTESKSYNRHKHNNKQFSSTHKTNEDWNAYKTIKMTVMPTKEGIEKKYSDIRMALNKITNKNYETQKQIIIDLVQDIILLPEDENVEKGLVCKKVGQFIFDIASTNKFYSEVYADLFQELITQYASFRDILDEFVSNFNDSLNNIRYIDSNVNYDGYCDYIKMNEKRKSTSTFLVMLMNRSVLDTRAILNIIVHFQQLFLSYIDQDNYINEVDEITEMLFLLITLGKTNYLAFPEWEESILPNISGASQMKAKEHASLSSRSVFKYKDLVDKIA